MNWFAKLKNRVPFFKKNSTAKPIDFIDLSEDAHTAWWGKFGVNAEQSRYAKIGQVILCIDHYDQEWRIAHHHEGQEETCSKTIAAHIMQGEVSLKPVLPDRPLFIFLENTLFLPAKSSIPLYLNLPIFIRILIGSAPLILEEIPTEVLSDTWHGKNTISGELGYAIKQPVIHRLEELSKDNIHAITSIHLTNQSPDNILIKELKIPVPFFTLFCDQQNRLWTEQLSITFMDPEISTTNIMKGAPKGLKEINLLSAPRYNIKNGFISLFNP